MLNFCFNIWQISVSRKAIKIFTFKKKNRNDNHQMAGPEKKTDCFREQNPPQSKTKKILNVTT